MDKRGITPIMATFLLISFAVAVGVVVMNLGRAQVESDAECPINIELKLSNIQGVDQLCYDSAKKELAFTVENGINIDVEGLIVNVISSQQAETFAMDNAYMGKAGVYFGHAPFDSSASGEIRQVKILPKVLLYDNLEICTEQALVIEEIRDC